VPLFLRAEFILWRAHFFSRRVNFACGRRTIGAKTLPLRSDCYGCISEPISSSYGSFVTAETE
jgi:hypothetical protein